MKIIDKIALIIFSMIVLIISILGSLVIFGWLDQTAIYLVISGILLKDTVRNVLLGVNIVFILLAIKAIFFESSSKKEKYNDSIVLENDDGKLIITKETLIGIINGVVDDFDSVKSCQTRILLDSENNLSIVLNIETTKDTIIKELINNLQIKIKEKLKDSLDVEVKNLDVRVKSIVEPKEESIKE